MAVIGRIRAIEMAETIKATATEFQNKFGRYRALAHHTPIIVTSHGIPDLVVISAQEYERLKARDRVALRPWELSDEEISALDPANIPAHTKAYDHEFDE